MSSDRLAALDWLPAPPADLRERLHALRDAREAVGNDLAGLANHALDENALRRLAQAVDHLRSRGVSFAPLLPFRLGIVGNATLAPLAPVLTATALRHGIALECVTAEYGQTLREALTPSSTINAAKCDAVLLALDRRGVPLAPHLDETTAAARVEEALAYVRAMRDGFRAHGGAACIVQTIAPSPDALFGSFDRALAGSSRSMTAAFNAALAGEFRAGGGAIFDVAALAETIGLANWDSPTIWNIAKLPFDPAFLPLYADHLCRIVGALRGRSRKCLVLDLDNTLWGGVIGDDGTEGIVIGEGDATGEAHLEVQRAALALRERGVVLAVSSKNEDAAARSAFSHPDMLLAEDHIAVFQANWNDKATNIVAIAKELDLGLDAMVFLDDNPAERALVRRMLPEVAVPELPDDAALYARTLFAAGYFESIAFSDEDRMRAGYYTDNARRVALARQAGDMDAYLASLEMTIDFRPFDATGRSRIAQLINKSNQFNLTTIRRTEAEVAALERDPAVFTLQIRLTDRFGDNGMIGVIVCRDRAPDAWEIDTWLMSCRVLGRGVEQMTLREIVAHARERGVGTLIGRYVPSAKNAMVAGHYERLGFRLRETQAGGATVWERETAADFGAGTMTVVRSGFDLVPA